MFTDTALSASGPTAEKTLSIQFAAMGQFWTFDFFAGIPDGSASVMMAWLTRHGLAVSRISLIGMSISWYFVVVSLKAAVSRQIGLCEGYK